MSKRRVLLIAPETDNLPYARREVQRVINALQPRVLLGEAATAEALLDELQQREFDVVWFAGHSTIDGLQMADGLLDGSRLTQLLRSQRSLELIYLNSCDSWQVAMLLYEQLPQAAVIATVAVLPDEAAYITGAMLAMALAAGLTVGEAYLTSRPGNNRQYILLDRQNRLEDGHEEEIRTIRMLNEWGRRLEQSIRDVEERLNGRIDEVRLEMHHRFGSLGDQYHIALRGDRVQAWMMAFLLFVLGTLLLVEPVRAWLGLQFWVALMAVLLLDGVAMVLFLYGLGMLQQ